MRMCACRGTAGFAHVSCLAEQAKILVDEADQNNKDAKWALWQRCKLCGQKHHGVVMHALGWLCWKTYLIRADSGAAKLWMLNESMTTLGLGLMEGDKYDEARIVFEAQIAELRRAGDVPDGVIIDAQCNLAACYGNLRLHQKALALFRELHAKRMAMHGPTPNTLHMACNLGKSLVENGLRTEGIAFLRDQLPHTRRLGPDHEVSFVLRTDLAKALYFFDAPRAYLIEALDIFTDVHKRARRVMGASHPITTDAGDMIRRAQLALQLFEAHEGNLEAHRRLQGN